MIFVADATMEAQNNNQPTLDDHNNYYKITAQEDQVQYDINHHLKQAL